MILFMIIDFNIQAKVNVGRRTNSKFKIQNQESD